MTEKCKTCGHEIAKIENDKYNEWRHLHTIETVFELRQIKITKCQHIDLNGNRDCWCQNPVPVEGDE